MREAHVPGANRSAVPDITIGLDVERVVRNVAERVVVHDHVPRAVGDAHAGAPRPVDDGVVEVHRARPARAGRRGAPGEVEPIAADVDQPQVREVQA